MEYVPAPQTTAAKIISYLNQIPEGAEVTTKQIAEAMGLEYFQVINMSNIYFNAGYILREKAGVQYFWRRGPRKLDPELVAMHPIVKHVELDFVPTRKTQEPKKEDGEVSEQIRVGQVLETNGFNPGPPQGKPESSSLVKKFSEPTQVRDTNDGTSDMSDDEWDDVTRGRTGSVAKTAPVEDEVPPMVRTRNSLINDPPAKPEPRAKTETMRVPVVATDMKIGIFSDGSLTIQRGAKVDVYSPAEAAKLCRFMDRMMLKNFSIKE